jgi:uncharacterized membrane protein (Fun14 family)
MTLRKKARLNRLSDISADIGQIAVLSLVIPYIDKFNIAMIVLGIIAASLFWWLSWYLAR